MKNGVKFGVIADVHIQMGVYAEKFLYAFLDTCRKEDVDFIVHLGDFCYPDGARSLCPDYSVNDRVLKAFNGFEKPAYHVLGNHDHDTCTKDEIMRLWGMKGNSYYSFDVNGMHFIVLDLNYGKVNGKFVPYGRRSLDPLPQGYDEPYLSDEQLVWLKQDLDNTPYPTVIFSHHRLAEKLFEDKNPFTIHNIDDFKEIIDNAPNRVVLCMNGHEHMDYAEQYDGVWYCSINSSTMHWLGEECSIARYTPEEEEGFLLVQATLPYSEALYAIVDIDEKGAMVKGKKADFVGPGPEELGLYTMDSMYPQYTKSMKKVLEQVKIASQISDRYMSFEKK